MCLLQNMAAMAFGSKGVSWAVEVATGVCRTTWRSGLALLHPILGNVRTRNQHYGVLVPIWKNTNNCDLAPIVDVMRISQMQRTVGWNECIEVEHHTAIKQVGVCVLGIITAEGWPDNLSPCW